MPQDLNIVHIWDGWFNSNYAPIMTFQSDDKLQIGGFGDYYTSPIRFDLTGLPATVDSAYLYLWALPSGAAGPSQVSMFPITSSWTPATIGWNSFPSIVSGYYWPVSTVVNAWRNYGITGWYNDWKNGVRSDNGILIWPYNNDGTQRFDKFASSRVAASPDARYFSTRPLIGLTFTPTSQLKMPLPGNHRWLVTTEVGGYDCLAKYPQYWPDTAHQGSNYFSIDFSWRNVPDSGATVYIETSNIPVIAAGGGKIYEATYSSGNGYYVVIDHDGDGNINTGVSTRYLHLKSNIQVYVGQIVQQGDILGYMGNTGDYTTGTHLHFGVRYNNNGASSIAELTKVVMDGWLLKSFQTECSVDANGVPTDWVRYFHSENRAY